MTDVDSLIRQIDKELESDVKEQKAAWAEVARITASVGRGSSATRMCPNTSSSC
jgi:hypothetical protein